MRCFLDENLSPQLAACLNASGHDAVCACDEGLGGKADKEIRDCAIQQNRVLITLDADFADLTRYPVAETPGVIWLKTAPPVTLSSIEHQLLTVIRFLQDRDLRGLLVIASKDRIRTRTGI